MGDKTDNAEEISTKSALDISNSKAGKITMAIIIPLMYFGISAGQGTYNPFKWKVNKGYTIQQNQNQFIQEFQRADSDSTGTLNFEEFYNYERGLYRR